MEENPIDRVLVGVPADPEGSLPLEYAASLCKILGAKLEVIHVIEELQVYNIFGAVPALNEKEIRKEKQKIFIVAERTGMKYGIEVGTKLVEGMSPGEELLREAREGKYDLIVVGCHGRSVLTECLLGGVSSQLVHHSNIPILVVKDKRGFSKILMCTGGSRYAEDAIGYAAEIARKAKSEVTVLSVAPSEDKRVIAAARKFANRGKQILKKKGVEAVAKVRTGHPAEEIILEARQGGYPLIVMGYKGTSAVVDLLLGDVVSKITHHCRRPVLVFREDTRKLKEE